jgi:eukaryotic-like serine/threonine-protein kinase
VFKYIARQPFWVNLLLAIILLCLLVVIFLGSLSWFTNHGAYLKVPLVKGRNVDEAVKLLEEKGFEVTIQDSVFVDSIPRYTVIKQLPDADATVKRNREVYLTINKAQPPPIPMPKLEGLSYRFAIELLQKNHLELGDTTMRPDFMKGSVLEQRYNGDKVEAGTNVPWGSKITLVIGAGLQEAQIPVPNLIGLTYKEAKALLDNGGIPLAGVLLLPGVTDTATAFVYKQNPPVIDEEKKPVFMKAGQTIDIWLSRDRPSSDSTQK